MKRFKNILCVVDIDTACEPALKRAVALAESNQANLTVAIVGKQIEGRIRLPEDGPSPADLQAAVKQAHEQALDTLLDPFRAHVDISTRILNGVPFLQIIREVLRNGHDLVIKTPDSHTWLHRLFGSNDMHLLRKCPCPVWLIKPEAKKSWRCILAAVDVGDAYPSHELDSRQALNRQVFEMASSLALSDFAELHLVHAWDAIGESAMRGHFMRTPEDEIKAYIKQVKKSEEHSMAAFLDEMASGQSDNAVDYLKPEVHVVKGWARAVIPKQAKKIKADLIVMGTVGRTGIPGFIMGNTAEEILNSIDCSVLAVKPPEFVTPVTLEE